VTALLKYIDHFARFLLAVFDAVFLHEFSCNIARKCVNITAINPEDHPIILPDSFCHQLFQKLFWHNIRMPTQ